MGFYTNRGRWLEHQWIYRGVALPATFYLALVTDTPAPTADTNTLGQLTQIATGNGYADGGYAIARNTTDFPTSTEDDDNDRADLLLKLVSVAASGGPIPASGSGFRYAVLTTDEATVADRQVIMVFDFTTARTVADTEALDLENMTVRAA